jgi:hypothetical protein
MAQTDGSLLLQKREAQDGKASGTMLSYIRPNEA